MRGDRSEEARRVKKKKKRNCSAQQEQTFRDGAEKQTSVKGRREFLPAALKVHWADNYMVFD